MSVHRDKSVCSKKFSEFNFRQCQLPDLGASNMLTSRFIEVTRFLVNTLKHIQYPHWLIYMYIKIAEGITKKKN